VVEADAALQIADYVLDLGVAPVIDFEFQHLAVAVGALSTPHSSFCKLVPLLARKVRASFIPARWPCSIRFL
jgi:hypothetical protein